VKEAALNDRNKTKEKSVSQNANKTKITQVQTDLSLDDAAKQLLLRRAKVVKVADGLARLAQHGNRVGPLHTQPGCQCVSGQGRSLKIISGKQHHAD
jgi:hypothetical protein